MKQLLILLTAGWFLLPMPNYGAETAQARIFCLSLKFGKGAAPSGGTVKLSSISGSYNGELYPYSGNTWASGLAIDWSGFADTGGIELNLPSFMDANSNGYNDFFEVSQGVAGVVTSGSYGTSTYFSGSINATWSRDPGSNYGTCILDLDDGLWGPLGNYTCQFELLEYAGPLSYTPGSNTVFASVSLTQTGDPANTLQGPIVFDKSSTDRFDTLTNQPGVWTNGALQALSFDNEIFSRQNPAWPANYGGYVYFADGDPGTGAPDYQLWVLSIDDPNDANANGIPDFSDDPGMVAPPPPPRPPRLSLALGLTNILLTISGDTGHTNQIQQTGSLSPADWQPAQSLLLTTDPQVVSLPLPAGAPKFWRVLAR